MNKISIKPKIIVQEGRPKEVILGIKDYERLLENAEDKEDIAELKRIKESKTSFRELNTYLSKYV